MKEVVCKIKTKSACRISIFAKLSLVLLFSGAQTALAQTPVQYVPTTATTPSTSSASPVRDITQARARAAIATPASTAQVVPSTGPSAIAIDPLNMPAVAYVNGWIGGSLGGWHSEYLHTGYLALVDGGLTIPFTHYFGAQLDFYDGVIAHNNLFATDGYIFYRNPCFGLIAFHYNYTDIDHVYANSYAGRLDWYWYNWTLNLESGSLHTNVRGGTWYGELFANWYPLDDWLVNLGIARFGGNYAVQGGAEYQFIYGTLPGIGLYADVGGGNHEAYYGWVGLRFYLGCDKTLIRRHREDTLRPIFTLNNVNRRKHWH